MNRRAAVSLRRLLQLVGALAFTLVVTAGVQVAFTAPAHAQENVVDPAILIAESTGDGTVIFTWEADPAGQTYEVFGGPGVVCSNSQRESTSCESDVGAPVCAMVQGRTSAGVLGAPSNWLCADGDPFDVGAVVHSLSSPYTIGRILEGEPIPTSVASNDCIVDLSFNPRFFLCVSSDVTGVATAVGNAPRGPEKVLWIGTKGETPVDDFDPSQFAAVLAQYVDPSGTQAKGETITLTITIANEPIDARDQSVPPKLHGGEPFARYSFFVEPEYSGVAFPDNCQRNGDDKWIHCLVGNLEPNASTTVVLMPTFRDDITNAQARGTLYRSSLGGNLPHPSEDVAGENGATVDEDGNPVNGDTPASVCVADRQPPSLHFLQINDLTSGAIRQIRTNATVSSGCDVSGAAGECADCDDAEDEDFFWGIDGSLFRRAVTFSHPNLATFDGRRYIFHGAGDYALVESTVDDFAIHVRFSRMDSTTVSFNRALVATVGDSKISFGDDTFSMAWDTSLVRLDGELITPTATPLDLPGGATVTRIDGLNVVEWPDGTILRAGSRVADPWSIDVTPERFGRVRGLLGNANGNRGDDLLSRDGAPFDYNSMELYTVFGLSWLLDEDATLFDAPLAPIDAQVIIPSAVVTLADLDPAAVASAEALCRAAGIKDGAGLAECVFDVALTGDPRWISGINLVDDVVARSISVLAELGLIETDETLTLPVLIQDEIEQSGSVDLYRFDLQAGEPITIDATLCANRSTFEFALEAPGGYFIGRSRGANCGRLGIFNVPQTGEYVLRVYDVNGYTGEYEFNVRLPASTSSLYVLDTVGIGTLDPGGEVFNVFDVTEDGTEIYFDGRSCFVTHDWQLLGVNGEVLADRGCRSDFTRTLDAGRYTVRHYSDNSSGGNFDFRLYVIPERQSFDMELGDVVSGQLSFPTDRHEYTFTVAQDGTEVFFDSETCFVLNNWRLTRPDGSSAFDVGCRSDRALFLDSGEWVLTVYSDSDDFASYGFRTWVIPERQSFDMELGDVVSGQLSFPTDRHEYTFTVAQDGTEVFFDNQTCFVLNNWRLTRPDGSSAFDVGCRSDRALFLDAGEWVLTFYSDSDDFASYGFRTWVIPERQSFDMELGDTVNSALSFPTDRHEYTFTVAQDGTEVFFDNQTCFVLNNWRLTRPDGSSAFDVGCRSDRALFLDAGEWVLTFYSDSDDFASYGFRTWVIPERQSFDMELGDVVSGQLSFPTDRHEYTFNVPADGTSVVFDNQTCFVLNNWRLSRPGGSNVFDVGCRSDRTVTLNAGEWVLTFYSDSDDFGSYGFQVREQ